MIDVRFHADDFGITPEQAREILKLTKPEGGPLGSVSIFVNSPAFAECAQMLVPYAQSGSLIVRPHLNLVEGHCVTDPAHVPLLVDDRGMFRNDFVGLMKLAHGTERRAFELQLSEECSAQLERFLEAFPYTCTAIESDSHQHTHMIPAVFDALLSAADKLGCLVSYIRIPVEPWEAHTKSGHRDRLKSLNTAKNLLLGHYAHELAPRMPEASRSSTFSGIVLSGHMEDLDTQTLELLRRTAEERGGMLEVLFHPVSMKPEECLDPANAPFTAACCSPHRDAEAEHLRRIATWTPYL